MLAICASVYFHSTHISQQTLPKPLTQALKINRLIHTSEIKKWISGTVYKYSTAMQLKHYINSAAKALNIGHRRGNEQLTILVD